LLQEPRGSLAGPRNGIVDAQLDLAFLVEPPQKLDFVPRISGDLHLRPAEAELALDAEQEVTFEIGRGLLWDVLGHELLRVIDEHPVHLAGCVLGDFAAEGVGRVLVDAGDTQRRAIRNRCMTVRAREDHRIVGRDVVEIAARRESGGIPEGLDPAAPFHPLAAFFLGDFSLHRADECGQARHSFEVQRGFALPDAGEVHVRVDEPGNDRPPLEVHHPRRDALIGRNFEVRPHQHDAAVFDGNGVGGGSAVPVRIDAGIFEYDVGGDGSLLGTAGPGRQRRARRAAGARAEPGDKDEPAERSLHGISSPTELHPILG
jgi:hypothetical protein